MPPGRPPAYTDPKEMQEIVDQYFKECLQNRLDDAQAKEIDWDQVALDWISGDKITDDRHPTISGIAFVLGFSRTALLNYEDDEEFVSTVKEAKRRVELYAEQKLYSKHTQGVIFSLKNNFKWKDRQEIEQINPPSKTGELSEVLGLIRDITGKSSPDSDAGAGKK